MSRSELLRAKNTILLPDDPRLWELARQRDPKLNFIVVQVEGVAGSILQALRRDPEVRSLRDAAGPPLAIIADGNGHSDLELLAFVRRLHTGKVAEALPKNLQHSYVSAEDLRQNWRHLLSGIKEVVTVDTVRARYELRRSSYEVQVRGAPDVQAGVIYVASGGDPVRALYDAVAQLILHRTTLLSGAAVQNAAESDNYDFRFSGARGPAIGGEDDDSTSREPGAGDLRAGHRSRTAVDRLPDPTDFNPSGVDPEGPKRSPRQSSTRRSTPKANPARDTIQEEEEKIALRERHYAHHCQACLGAYQPAQVAPPDSYVSEAAYRSTLLQAHHVDHLQTSLVLGARNLLLLCEHHHRKLGDLLTGVKVLSALGKATSTVRRFEANGESGTLKGLVAEVTADSSEGVALLFFTREHADAWRGRLSE